ncbi:hypothetical protein OJAV_G00186090 [Oryzias javanicus]|uniref:Uncharacterized protein n=1 Tax=Oryzias javanicus TaxID=123683 RepID=A0A437C8X4_ORYJA|nr:hypothetical protein OJAV_G00186090 [Oryzias javanicus]
MRGWCLEGGSLNPCQNICRGLQDVPELLLQMFTQFLMNLVPAGNHAEINQSSCEDDRGGRTARIGGGACRVIIEPPGRFLLGSRTLGLQTLFVLRFTWVRYTLTRAVLTERPADVGGAGGHHRSGR